MARIGRGQPARAWWVSQPGAVPTFGITATPNDGYSDTFVGSLLTTLCYTGVETDRTLTGFFRMLGVAIPQGATITSATLTLNVLARFGSPAFNVAATAEDDAAAVSGVAELAARTRTTATAWTPAVTGSHAIDVTAAVQAVVNRAGWASGNAMLFVTDSTVAQGTLAEVQVSDYSQSPTLAARLSVVVGVGGTPATATPATIATVVALPAPTVQTGSQVTPAVIATTSSFPAPTVGAGTSTQLATIATVAAVPAPTVTTGTQASPATIATTAGVPAPTVSVTVVNTAEGYSTDATVVTTGNSGGGSGRAFSAVTASVVAARNTGGAAREGSWFYELTPASGGAASVTLPLGASSTQVVARRYAYLTGYPSAVMEWVRANNSAGQNLNLGTSGIVNLGMSPFTAAGTALPLNQWFREEMIYDQAGSITYRFYDTDDSTILGSITQSGLTLGTGAFTTVQFGKISSAGNLATFRLDALAAASNRTTEIGSIPGGTPATATPATIATVTAVSAPTVQTDSQVTATTIATASSFPAPTISAGTGVQPVTVATTAALAAPTVTTGTRTSPATIATVSAVPAPTVQTGSQVAAVTVVTVTALPSPTVRTGSGVSPATIATAAALPAPSVSAGGNATPAPATIATTTSVPSVALSTGQRVSASAIATTSTLPAPTVRTGATVVAATIVTVAAVGGPGLSTGMRVTATTLATTTALPAPTIVAQTQTMPGVIATTVSMPAPSLRTGSTVAAQVIATYATVGAALVQLTGGGGTISTVPRIVPTLTGGTVRRVPALTLTPRSVPTLTEVLS
jgi:hypothetical protein